MTTSRSMILFDIDATLLSTDGAGMRAMAAAGRRMFGPGFAAEDVDYAGRLDPLIIADLMVVNRVSPTAALLAQFRQAYVEELGRLLFAGGGRSMPGVDSLLARLRDETNITLGLLTGNIEQGGLLKLAACGIDAAPFVVRVWGDAPWRDREVSPAAVPTRDDLPPVAQVEYERRFGASIAPTSITIIGDTPHDVRCAKVNGCRSLGVATGRYSMQELAGADRVVRNLASDDDLWDWLLAV